MAARQPRTELSLNKKIELIKRAESTNLSQRKLAEEFGIGRTQVGSILKRKRDYEDALDRNECGAKRRFAYSSANNEVNRITWEWFIRMRAQNLSVTGPMIQQQALNYASALGMIGFKASNGWLEAFKKRHNIGQSKICGENTSLDSDIVSEWYSKLGRLHEGYGPEDLYNMDEMNCFYRALPDRSLVLCGNEDQSGNFSMDKLTVVLCCNMKGDFLPSLVIGKSEKPVCFKNTSSVQCPVILKSNREGRMTSSVFSEWVNELDMMMRLEQRHILLFLDNAVSHTQEDTLTNVKLVFFPASHLQPLDQGVIHNIKVHYRKYLLLHVMAVLNNESSATVSSVISSISILDACHWVASALKDINQVTIFHSFVCAGFPKMLVGGSLPPPPEDPTPELEPLIVSVTSSLSLSEPLNAQEYASLEFIAPVSEMLSDTWTQDLLTIERKPELQDEADSDSRPESSVTEPTPKSEIKDLATALYWAQQLKLFALERDMSDLLSTFSQGEDILTHELITKAE